MDKSPSKYSLDHSGTSPVTMPNSYTIDCSGISLHENPSSFTVFNTIRQSLLSATFKDSLVAGSTNGHSASLTGHNSLSDTDVNTVVNQLQVTLNTFHSYMALDNLFRQNMLSLCLSLALYSHTPI